LGSSAFDKAWNILDTFPALVDKELAESRVAKSIDASISVFYATCLIRSLLLPTSMLPQEYLDAFRHAVSILYQKSKSFYVASLLFPMSIRQDSIALYAFCRATDDVIDEASNSCEASNNLQMMIEWLDLVYSTTKEEPQRTDLSLIELRRRGPSKSIISFLDPEKSIEIRRFLLYRVPVEARPLFLLLSTIVHRVPRYTFDDLLRGYKWDLERSSPIADNLAKEQRTKKILVETQDELVQYSRFVAGSVGEMMVWTMLGNQRDLNVEGLKPLNAHFGKDVEQDRLKILSNANDMGVVLQIINIARDIREDAEKLGRVYIPFQWFNEKKASSIKTLNGDSTFLLASSPSHLSNLLAAWSPGSDVDLSHFPYATYTIRLLDLADSYYYECVEAIESSSLVCRRVLRAMVEVYREIGREIYNRDIGNFSKLHTFLGDGRRVKVPNWRRIKTALKCIYNID
jgi:15-cis-phytoene synthase/lycopene beta-cyclase